MAKVAARIGPSPTDLLVDDPGVPEVKLAAFDFRAGYRRAAEIVNPYRIDVTLDEDRIALAGPG